MANECTWKCFMFRTARRVAWVMVAAVLMTAMADARVVENWPSSKLTEKADLIVIAKFVSSVDAKVSDKPPQRYEEDIIGVDSKFKVLAVMKGKLIRKNSYCSISASPLLKRIKNSEKTESRKGKAIDADLVPANTPCRSPGPGSFRQSGGERIRYLMFLEETRRRAYECVSGQIGSGHVN